MAEILLIGEDRDRAGAIRPHLRGGGHNVTWTRTVNDWSEAEEKTRPEVVVAAVESPDELLRVRRQATRGFAPPILFVHYESDLTAERNLDERLVDRVSCPFLPEELLARVDALVKVRRIVMRSKVQEEARGGITGFGQSIRSILSRTGRRDPLPSTPYLEVSMRLADWTDRRDMFEPGHAGRVASFCAMMADGIDLPDHEVGVLLRAAMLHDIGKVTVPFEILRQEGPLDETKMRLVRTHPERGAALVRALESSEEVARTILYHHERPDGKGYYGKPREAVPRPARMLAVAEAYDAMTATRWRAPVFQTEALGILRDQRGESFDEESVDALARSLAPRSRRIALQV